MWKSLDSVEEPRPGGAFSEDYAGTSGPMAWILDGASAVSQERVTRAASDARWLVEHLDAELRVLSDNTTESLRTIVAEAIARTAAQAEDDWTGTPEVLPSAALGVVRHARDCTEFLVLADVSVILMTEAGALEMIDRRVDKHTNGALEAMVHLVESKVPFDEVSERTRTHLAEPRRAAMNRENGYWVASIDPVAASHALSGTLDGVRDVVLASDGFMRALHLFRLVPNADTLFDCDFRDLARRIRKTEADDPDTSKFPRWRVSDDICAHRLRWVD